MTTTSSHSFQLPTTLHYDLSIPGNGDSKTLLIALHGYGENKNLMQSRLDYEITKLCIIANLQAPYPHIVPPVMPGKPIKHGFGWITSFQPDEAIKLHHLAIDTIIQKVKAHHEINQIILLGFSQSVALNFRYLFTYPDKIDKIIAICGGIPGDWHTSSLYKSTNAKVYYFGCNKDSVYPPIIIKKNSDLLKVKSSHVTYKIFDCKHEMSREIIAILPELIAIKPVNL